MDQTSLHPLGLMAVLVLGVAMFWVRRRFAIAPILVMACFVSPGQRLVLASLDFDLLRLMLVLGWCRVLWRGEYLRWRWRWIDSAVVIWCCSVTCAVLLRDASLDPLIYRLGMMFESLGAFFLFRSLIRSWRDVNAMIVAAALLSVPVAAVFLVEQITGRNMFAIFGGVPEITVIRDGRLRCRGPFPHPIIAGCFWAVLMPLIASLWCAGSRTRWLAPIGILASLLVVQATGSATPISAALAAMFGGAFILIRRHVWWLRWMAVASLIPLQMIMVNPIWHLLARVDFVSGATGWYRFKMIDGFLRHVDRWWLYGTNAFKDLWGHEFDMVTNQYVFEGVEGGLLALTMFILIIVLTFSRIGAALHHARSSRRRIVLTWMLGAAMFVHVVSFLGVAYFGQINMLWYLTIAAAFGVSGRRVVNRSSQRAPLRSVPQSPVVSIARPTPAPEFAL